MKTPAPQTTEASALDKRHSTSETLQNSSVPLSADAARTMSSMIELCLITSIKPPVVTKVFSLDEHGQLQRETSADVWSGRMAIKQLDGLAAFAELLESLEPNQCLTYGIPPHDAKLTTEKNWVQSGRPSNLLPRTKEVFSFPSGGGILMLDYDAPKDGSQKLSKEELFALLRQAIPGFEVHDHIWWPSTSSCIYRGNKQLRGIEGQRIYVSVAEGRDIERAGKALNARLWSLGFGRFEISASGSLLERGVFDQSVWQSNHIDFAAGAKCGPGLEQRRGKPVIDGIIGYGMDTREVIPELTPLEQSKAAANKEAARRLLRDDAEHQRKEWLDERISELINAKGIPEERARILATRAVDNRSLLGDWQIICKGDDGEEIAASVLDVLDHPERFHGRVTLDPLEPDYDGRRWVGKLWLYGGRPNLYSMAHGGANFRLSRQPARIEVVSGKAREATDALLELLKRSPDVFDFGAELVTVSHGNVFPTNEHSLRYTVGGMTQFWQWRKTPQGVPYEQLLDPPPAIMKSVLALGSQRHLKPLDAVITAPTLRPDGSVFATIGYDAQTRLLYDAQEELPFAIPERPSLEEGLAALEYLWKPFVYFPFVDALARSVHLAALLTAAVRPVLPTAPAFAYDAPVQGSGKTLLARCIAVLATGEDAAVWPHTAGRDDEETRKRIFAALRSGARVLVWDNVTGDFDSAAMASAMTSPTYQDRILGSSSSSVVPNRAMIILTGNNLSLKGEMPRRVLKSRIIPQTDKPFARHFEFDPFDICLSRRQELIAAALTLIRCYLTHDHGPLGKGKLASFEDWDTWVRQTVIFANTLKPGMFGDLMAVIDANQALDSEQAQLRDLLACMHKVFGEQPVTTKTVLEAAESGYLYEDLDSKDRDNAALSAQAELDKLARASLAESLNELPIKTLNSASLGKFLQYRKDRIVNGLCLRSVLDTASNCNVWRVERVQT